MSLQLARATGSASMAACSSARPLQGPNNSAPRALRVRALLRSACTPLAAAAAYPDFIPSEIYEIEEPAALEMAQQMSRVQLEVPSKGRSFGSVFVGPSSSAESELPPVCMLHGFDSSSLEFRRLHPLLNESMPAYALDLLGWGFNDQSVYAEDPTLVIGPEERTEHLYSFWKAHMGGQPMVLLGASLGGATAIHFALAHPEAVAGLVLLDAQGFIDGIGPMSSAPRFLLNLGVQVLKAEWLRESANQMAYFNKEQFATPDARRVGRLHTFAEGWSDANIAWMRSGGYSLSQSIPKITCPTLVMWGENDEILDPKYAEQFREALPDAEVVIVPECGHCAHLEQPTQAAELITQFAARVTKDVPAPASA